MRTSVTLVAVSLLLRVACPASAEEAPTGATITSDELEIQDHGERTIFTGHVRLKDDPYHFNADRMVRTKSDGVVDASGHLHGTWRRSPDKTGEAWAAVGRYSPSKKLVELWGKERVKVRWEDAKGIAEFEGDRGWVFLDVGRARLADQVRGRITPR